MKCTTVIDKEREEEIFIYVHERSELTEQIEALVRGDGAELLGFTEHAAVKLQPTDILCVTVNGRRVLAITEREQLQLKHPLYVLEKRLGRNFMRINQSCIVNMRQIARFETSIGGALLVILKNGYKDYVSRRQLKAVKERMGM